MLKREDLEAVVLDFDGTLVKSDIDFDRMRRQVREHLYAWALDPTPVAGRLILEMIAWAREQLAATDPARAEQYHSEVHQIIWAIEGPCCAQAVPFPGVPEALRRAGRAGLKLGIITRNSRAGVELVLERHPLPVSVIITRDDTDLVKPLPHHLLMALERLEVEPGCTLMVGDHPTDVECGRAAGACTCGILTTGRSPQDFYPVGADLVCADVPALVDLLLDQAKR